MTKLVNQLITPQSTLIEKVALEFAAVFYEAGRASGMTSKHNDARSYARAYVERFIPLAVDHLMTMIGHPSIPPDQKDLIYDAFMERVNDKELSNIGLPIFKNDLDFIPDWKAPSEVDLALDKALKDMKNGQEKSH